MKTTTHDGSVAPSFVIKIDRKAKPTRVLMSCDAEDLTAVWENFAKPLIDYRYSKGNARDSNYGCAPSEVTKRITEGHEEGRAQIEEYAATVENIVIERYGRQDIDFDYAPFGTAPDVGSALAGNPFPFSLPGDTANDRTPIRIFLDVCASWGVRAEDLEKRGAIACGLAMGLSRIRPVELYAVDGGNHRGIDVGHLIRIGSSPFDSKRLSGVSSVEFLRRFGFGMDYYGAAQAFGGSFESDPHIGWMEAKPRQLYDIKDTDILLGGMHMSDVKDFESDPVEWVVSRTKQALKGHGSFERSWGGED